MTEDRPSEEDRTSPEEQASASTARERRDEQKQKWYQTTWGQIVLSVGGLAIYLLFGLLLWWMLDRYINPDGSTQKKDLVQALALIMAGVAGAIGIYFTWRGQSHARDAQEANQRNTLEQLDLTRRGQMTERFTQAIEQLGNEKLEIKLGRIYSLERTAQDEKDYHWPIMEVLTSYVRRHAARKPEKKSGESGAPPEPDIQAILDVIGRRSEYHRTDKKVEYGTIELTATDLRGARLHSAYLQGAKLVDANFRGADLTRANLQEAVLLGADLHHATVMLADLQGATLANANLQSVNFGQSDLRRADLHGAKLQGAYFGGAKLQGADFRDADLTVAQLDGAYWDESILFSSELHLRLRLIEGLRARLPQLELDWRRAREEGTPESKQREERLRSELMEIPQRIEDLRQKSPE